MNVTITDSSVLPKSVTVLQSGDVVNVSTTTSPVTVSVDQLTTQITGTLDQLTNVSISNVQNDQVLVVVGHLIFY